jgi:acetyl-CoA/propionyl-CoA carboxylase biotin carboxyl carrier protein
VRNDFGIDVSGGDVPSAYDSMIGKVLAHAGDRAAARRRLVAALDDLRITGIPTTAAYLRAVLESPSFTEGTHDTGSVAREWPPAELLGVGAGPEREPDGGSEPGRPRLGGLPAAEPGVGNVLRRTVRFTTAQGERTVAVYGPARPDGVTGRPASTSGTAAGTGRTDAPSGTGGPAPGDPVAPMDATVVELRVSAGDQIEPGTVLAVLEAMKMEMEVRAGVAGTVDEVLVRVGAPVPAGAALVSLR